MHHSYSKKALIPYKERSASPLTVPPDEPCLWKEFEALHRSTKLVFGDFIPNPTTLPSRNKTQRKSGKADLLHSFFTPTLTISHHCHLPSLPEITHKTHTQRGVFHSSPLQCLEDWIRHKNASLRQQSGLSNPILLQSGFNALAGHHD
ncbi:hypothetical protein JTE90_022290 [Oedothorax gibbosus]|uniref:Uncharacterized protein n=1 Tax=Oedothorax gibbosus TaxID=931172 RepID=A0AAV6VXW6_9ARAC|nr:hypothetical protein JTE90_022290 [Oedothorax gibbosus]